MDETFSCSQEKSTNNKQSRIVLRMDTPTYQIKKLKKNNISNNHFSELLLKCCGKSSILDV